MHKHMFQKRALLRLILNELHSLFLKSKNSDNCFEICIQYLIQRLNNIPWVQQVYLNEIKKTYRNSGYSVHISFSYDQDTHYASCICVLKNEHINDTKTLLGVYASLNAETFIPIQYITKNNHAIIGYKKKKVRPNKINNAIRKSINLIDFPQTIEEIHKALISISQGLSSCAYIRSLPLSDYLFFKELLSIVGGKLTGIIENNSVSHIYGYIYASMSIPTSKQTETEPYIPHFPQKI